MSQLEKLLEQFINIPFPKWNDVLTLLKKLGYKKLEGDGSRIKFVNPEKKSIIELHRPHPQNAIKTYTQKDIIKKLKEQGVIK
ncbi:LOW QUALITY PROTEIN: HicA protein [Methylobacter tundripaludum SV96]|uniref:HicA protein n=1 Tax=Methylobacter tundripaludum (strain ATCC BAA-1195 / DSM 17260 / SV96) TaxID=697282 RepID=G3IVA3_METTV|nr:LOW QUALITY PROTEIN: HicA protein [Methylobacter tundripaludum SV96]